MLLVIAYRVTVSIGARRYPKSNLWDWPVQHAACHRMAFWTIGTGRPLRGMCTSSRMSPSRRSAPGSAQLSALHTLFLLTAQMLQPAGCAAPRLCIAHRSKLVSLSRAWSPWCACSACWPLSWTSRVWRVGWVLVIMTCVLVDGRVRNWLSRRQFSFFVAFPVFQGYRTVTEGGRLIKREAAVEHLLAVLQKSLDARDRVNTPMTVHRPFFGAPFDEGERSHDCCQNGSGRSNFSVAIRSCRSPRPSSPDSCGRKPDIPTGRCQQSSFT